MARKEKRNMGTIQNPRDVNLSESKTDNRGDVNQTLYIGEFEVKGVAYTVPAINKK
jgi:hypothetical protein